MMLSRRRKGEDESITERTQGSEEVTFFKA